jgi:aerobic carbon-monoxide dehydrogenase medium subunit
MVLPAFALARPTTVEEALGLLSEERVPFCGGTELLLAMRSGLHRPEVLVDLKRVPELRGVRIEGDVLVVGAATTHAEMVESDDVRRRVPVLHDVERRVGNARVRNQGSVAGNLCFAEPKSDVATVLVALDASVRLRSVSREREVAVADFVAGAYWADKEPDELLVEVRVPLVAGRRGAYAKMQITERPTVGAAVVVDADGSCRVTVGAVAETPLLQLAPSLDEVDVDGLASELDPVEDLTGSAPYKRQMTRVYLRRALDAVREQSGADDDR